jgi:hypothetical protein
MPRFGGAAFLMVSTAYWLSEAWDCPHCCRDRSNGRHEFAFRGERTHDLSPSVTRIRFFVDFNQPECGQNPDIPPHGRPVSLENGSELRNGRWIPSYRIENANPLRSEHPKQIGGILKSQAHLRKQPLGAIQLLCASSRSPEKGIRGARTH